MASANNPYVALKAGYQQSLNDAKAADQALLQQKYDQDIASANRNYNNAANEAYIAYRQSQAALPEQLSSAGLSGGASESAMARLQAAYGANLANNAAARQNAMTELGNGYQNNLMALQNSYLKQISDAIADYDRLIAEWEMQNAAASGYGYGYGGGGSGGGGAEGDSIYLTDDVYDPLGKGGNARITKDMWNAYKGGKTNYTNRSPQINWRHTTPAKTKTAYGTTGSANSGSYYGTK